jgi:hypothetical protein
MPDNWGFVIAAYGLAAIVLIAYWRFLFRREKELDDARDVRQQLSHTREPNPARRGPLS